MPLSGLFIFPASNLRMLLFPAIFLSPPQLFVNPVPQWLMIVAENRTLMVSNQACPALRAPRLHPRVTPARVSPPEPVAESLPQRRVQFYPFFVSWCLCCEISSSNLLDLIYLVRTGVTKSNHRAAELTEDERTETNILLRSKLFSFNFMLGN